MARLNGVAIRHLIKGGETTTVEFKVATPRPVEMADCITLLNSYQ